MKVLSIDDAGLIRNIIKHAVLELNQEFLEAENGKVGLALLEKVGPVDLILLDYNMPEMDGMETLKQLKENNLFKDIRVVMVTTEIDRGKIVTAIKNGAIDYLIKPFEKDDLVAKIKKHLNMIESNG